MTNLGGSAPNMVSFYNQRGTAEQWIKEGKYAVRDKLIKIGGKRVRHAQYVTFQLAEVTIPRRSPATQRAGTAALSTADVNRHNISSNLDLPTTKRPRTG